MRQHNDCYFAGVEDGIEQAHTGNLLPSPSDWTSARSEAPELSDQEWNAFRQGFTRGFVQERHAINNPE